MGFLDNFKSSKDQPKGKGPAKGSGKSPKVVWDFFFKAVFKQEWDKALMALEELRKLEPDNSQVYLKIAELKQRKADKAGAVEGLLKASECLINEGVPQKAQAIYKMVLRIDPANQVAQKALQQSAAPARPTAAGTHPPQTRRPALAPGQKQPIAYEGISLEGIDMPAHTPQAPQEAPEVPTPAVEAPVATPPEAPQETAPGLETFQDNAAPAEPQPALDIQSFEQTAEPVQQDSSPLEGWGTASQSSPSQPSMEPASEEAPAQQDSAPLEGWDTPAPETPQVDYATNTAALWDTPSEAPADTEPAAEQPADQQPSGLDFLSAPGGDTGVDQAELELAGLGLASPEEAEGAAEAPEDEGMPSIFSFLSIEDMENLSKNAKYKTFTEGQVVVKENDIGDSMYVIKHGAARVVAHFVGKVIELGTLGQGDIFGEVAFLTGKPRTASVIASGELEVMEITKALLQSTIDNNPLIFDSLLDMYHARAQSTVDRIRKEGKGQK